MKKENVSQVYGRYQKRNNPAVIILSICLALTILVMGFLVFAHVNWSIEFNTENTQQVIQYRDSIKLPQAHLVGRYVCIKPVSLNPKIAGHVNTNQIGTHQVKYVAQKWGYHASLIQNIVVIDNKAPTIELQRNENYYVMPGEEYIEEGYRAIDEYDGDITDKVIKTQEGNIITYTVKDSSGNTASVQREIQYRDPIKPEIALVGDENFTLISGDLYIDPGAVATDNCDGDITHKITITGAVNTYVLGTYTILYEVSDSFGNKASITRNVTVIENKPEQIEPVAGKNGKTIYLTFDDGPGPYTEELLDVLKKYDVEATFFVVGKNCTAEILKRMAEEGHAIGLHSTNHNYSIIYKSEDAFVADLLKMQKQVEEMSGIKTYLLRFPGGSSNTISKNYSIGIMKKLTKKVQELGFQYFDWNVDSEDASRAKDAETVIKNIKKGVEPFTSSIVLQHDIKDYSVAAVEEIIIWGLENGYTFAKLDVTSPAAHHPTNN